MPRYDVKDAFFNYRIGAQLGRGRWSTVHRSKVLLSATILRTVAIKVKIGAHEREPYVEGWIHAKLHHPNVVELHRAFGYQGHEYLVMELCDNGSLSDLLRTQGTMTLFETAKVLIQLLGALRYIHGQGVVHRDVKPQNVLLDTNGNAKLGDFGLAAFISTHKRLHQPCGTTEYMSPEVLDVSQQGYDEKADIWSAGVLMSV
ncbi:class II myosin [Exophiala xenobiotica]|nr:class II myosin [Exophiala xenobiotica]